MCYSAQVWAEYEKYVRHYGADIDITTYYELYVDKSKGAKLKTPKAMDAAFDAAGGPKAGEIAELVKQIHATEISALEQDLFKQVKRLADAERALQSKQTKKALDDQRIADNKIEQLKIRLANLKRTEWKPSDSRIFPGMYAPVMVWEDGRRVVKPMRYQCRQAGKPGALRSQVPGHLQRQAGQSRRILEAAVRPVARDHGRRPVLRERGDPKATLCWSSSRAQVSRC